MYISSKKYGTERGYSVAYRQWRADSHCSKLHGYALSFYFEFCCEDLDARNWVCDFGGFKTLKYKLDEWFDHTLLVAEDDPCFKIFENLHDNGLAKMVVVSKTGCEGIAEFLNEYISQIWLQENGYSGRVTVRKIIVSETESNSGGIINV